MRDGMYHVIFSSAQGAGEGLAVFKGESVNGGDDGYLYTGPKTQKGDAFKSTLTIKKWKQDAQSIFGNVQQFTLNLEGRDSPGGGFEASGHVVGQPDARISIRGRFLSELA